MHSTNEEELVLDLTVRIGGDMEAGVDIKGFSSPLNKTLIELQVTVRPAPSERSDGPGASTEESAQTSFEGGGDTPHAHPGTDRILSGESNVQERRA